MAAILPASLSKAGKKIHSLKIDMTPMVDLGFLLITFFIFTTSMTEPRVTKLIMPHDGVESDYPASKSLTAIVAKEKTIVYEGLFTNAIASRNLVLTDFNVKTGFGQLIREKQKTMEAKGQKEELMVLIKPLASASYGDVMNALDEMKINNVQRYAIVNVSPEEKEYAVLKNQ
jgi:biopolymer transport protein ExbD